MKPPENAEWSVASARSPVVCHGDPQPPNFAWRRGQVVGLSDWDAARPAAPIEDVAYALLWFTPVNADDVELRRRGFEAVPDRRARAERCWRATGWDQPVDIVEAAVSRHGQAIEEVVLLANRGHEPHASWVAGGWPDRWRASLAELRGLPLNPPHP